MGEDLVKHCKVQLVSTSPNHITGRFNMYTFNRMWGVVTPEEAAAKIEEQRKEAGITDPRNLEEKVVFGGRLGEYKYYDMDQVIAVALKKAQELIED